MVTSVNFYPKDYDRRVTGAQLILKNRYFEQDPHLSADGSSLIARPGLKFLTNVGAGPIRGLFQSPGFFNGDLFVASYDSLYRLDKDLNATYIINGLRNPERGVVNMTSTAPIGDTVPAYLFFTDGSVLYYYTDNGSAQGTVSGSPVNNDVIRIGDTYYKFTNGSVDSGTPDGTSGNPWLVAVEISDTLSWTNFAAAIMADGTAGTQYSSALTAHSDVAVGTKSATSVTVRARVAGVLGNGIVTTETGAGISWTNGTLEDGGTTQVGQVQTPDDIGVFDVATINSFVICIPTQEADTNGRFYWIEPGEIFINPLNYATAERSPDGINGVEVVGDQFWLPGSGSTEVWYVSSDPINRMQRLQGVVFDRGTWEGTAIAVHETLIVCSSDGAVFAIRGGAPQRVSTPDIEEQIREAIAYQLSQTP